MATAAELRRLREEQSIFAPLYEAARQQQSELAAQGRRPVFGGLLSKEPVYGTDTLRYEGIGNMLAGLLSPAAKAVDAPISAYRGTIPQEDMISEALGTAGLVSAGSLAASGRGALEYDPTTTRIFAGKRAAARTGDHRRSATAEAESLLEQGFKNREVYERTGVFRGADGKLRFEIDDSAASVLKAPSPNTAMRLEDYLTHPELYELYPSMRGMPVDFKQPKDMDGAGGTFSPSNQRISLAMNDPEKMRSILLHEAQHAVQNREGFSGGSSPTDDYSKTQAKEFSDNLFSSSDAKNMRYQYDSFNNQYDQIKPLYQVEYIDKLNSLSRKAIEGRAKPAEVTRLQDWYKYGNKIVDNLGPMPKRSGVARDNWIASASAQLRDFRLSEMTDFEKDLYNAARRNFDTPKDVKNAIKRIERKIEKHRAGAFGFRELVNRAREVQSLNAIDAYLREAGEVEARNVQARANPDNPKGFPLDTAEFSPNQQIISSLRAGQNLVDVSSQGRKPIGRGLLD